MLPGERGPVLLSVLWERGTGEGIFLKPSTRDRPKEVRIQVSRVGAEHPLCLDYEPFP